MDERRKAPRHPVELKITLDRGTALSRDISGLGVLFRTEAEFRIGEEIDFHIEIVDGVDVRCGGRVVRITPENGGWLVAATITRYALAEDAEGSEHFLLRELERFQPQGWEWGE